MNPMKKLRRIAMTAVFVSILLSALPAAAERDDDGYLVEVPLDVQVVAGMKQRSGPYAARSEPQPCEG